MERARKILLVDDEENILSSLKRLLKRDCYEIVTANGGEKGLQLLNEHENIGVIISDQRMPEMTGVEFLSKVKSLYPDTVRIVLSGYTDLKFVTDAINEGSIYKFLPKPWEDNLLRENIKKAFEDYELKQENQRLTNELKEANKALEDINKDLESRVEQKTREIMINMKTLEVSQDVLEHLPVGVIGVGEDEMIAVANGRARQMLSKTTAHGLVGFYTKQVLPDKIVFPDSHDRENEVIKITNEIDGKTVIFIISKLGKFSDGKGWIIVMQDKEE